MFKRKFLNFLIVFSVFFLAIASVAATDVENNGSNLDNVNIIDSNVNDDYSSNCLAIDDVNVGNYSFDSHFDNSDNDNVVRVDDDYSCGAGSLATSLNDNGVNASLDDVKSLAGTNVENGTSMEGIISAAESYNLSACGVEIATEGLRENDIVHMTLDGVDHWSVIKSVSDSFVALKDSSLGNVYLDLDDFNKYYSGHAVVLSSLSVSSLKDDVQARNGKLLKSEDTKKIFGKRGTTATILYTIRRGGGWFKWTIVVCRGYSYTVWGWI